MFILQFFCYEPFLINKNLKIKLRPGIGTAHYHFMIRSSPLFNQLGIKRIKLQL